MSNENYLLLGIMYEEVFIPFVEFLVLCSSVKRYEVMYFELYHLLDRQMKILPEVFMNR